MRYEIWFYINDASLKPLLTWRLSITKNAIEIIADAATRAMLWAQPHKVQTGRYEVNAILLTADEQEAFKSFLLSEAYRAHQASKGTPASPIHKPVAADLREILKLKKLRLTDSKVAEKLIISKDCVEKKLYRKRIHYGVSSTAELIDILEAAMLL